MQEQDDNMTEIANAIFSDLLTENPDQAILNVLTEIINFFKSV